MGIEKTRSRHMYELIRENHPCKFYMDLECIGTTPGLAEDMRSHLKPLLTQFLEAKWKERPQNPDFRPEVHLLEGSRDTPKGLKISFHAIVRNLVFETNHSGTMKALASAFQAHLAQEKPHWPQIVDKLVYSRNQKYRMPLSSKLSDPSGTTLQSTLGVMTRRQVLDALVTFIEEDASAIWVPSPPQNRRSEQHAKEQANFYGPSEVGPTQERTATTPESHK
jgi:hypothetical protein